MTGNQKRITLIAKYNLPPIPAKSIVRTGKKKPILTPMMYSWIREDIRMGINIANTGDLIALKRIKNKKSSHNLKTVGF